ncbi:hypothetical protein HU200_044701 [Digitaria exilis]|uniref:Uncharacterized protein n=1 Tax=Digitaria exilis TaxID=1010633 RepID=A0A835B1D0_9POAL|nr:hypothetical protein HU200_044701 [Digitaria exilis]
MDGPCVVKNRRRRMENRWWITGYEAKRFIVPLRSKGTESLSCSAAGAGDDGGKKVSARLALTQQVLRDAEERAALAGSDPAPKITLGS